VSRTWQGLILKGYNTDSPAFGSTLGPFLHDGLKEALILGTGGAAKAVFFALTSLGIGHQFVSRTAKPDCLTYTDLTPALIGQVQLIVNATPVGTKGLEEEFPHLPYEALGQGHLLYDLVYNPEETLFLRKGRQSGARIKNGLEMLKLQAGLSWDIWMKG
jgi:shikimate dehydrogenase